MKHRILVINPGSTSTKIAVFEGKEKLFDTTLRYSTEELASFGWEQVDFRRATIEKALADNNIDPDSLDAICARGGQVPYCAAGTYRVDQAMVDFMYTRRQGAHASNLGCVLALLLAKPLGIPAYIVDPVMVDEMDDVARVSGLPELPRKMQGHALNCRAMAIRCADEVLHKPLADCRLIVLHLGGGGSCRLFVDGRMVDCVRDDEWMFAPERFGGAAKRSDWNAMIPALLGAVMEIAALILFVMSLPGSPTESIVSIRITDVQFKLYLTVMSAAFLAAAVIKLVNTAKKRKYNA